MAVVRAGMGGVLCLELRVATVMAPGPLPRPGRDWCGAAFFVDLGAAGSGHIGIHRPRPAPDPTGMHWLTRRAERVGLQCPWPR